MKSFTSADRVAAAEAAIQRNPHGDFSLIESQRADWNSEISWVWTKTKNPAWKIGDGSNDGGASIKREAVEIDPHEAER